MENVLKVLSFLWLRKREGQKIIKYVTHSQLYFDCMDRFIAAGATPIKNSTLPLPKIKPPPFLDEQIKLSKFSALYTTYVGSVGSVGSVTCFPLFSQLICSWNLRPVKTNIL